MSKRMGIKMKKMKVDLKGNSYIDVPDLLKIVLSILRKRWLQKKSILQER